MKIRAAQHEDHLSIAELWRASAATMGAGTPPSSTRLLERITKSLAGGWQLEVATRDGLIIGFLAMKPRDRILDQLFVAPDQQGKGVGKKLLDRAKIQLSPSFTLRTPVTNVAAHRFYDRHGLRADRDEPHPTTGDPVRYFEWRR